jgi:leucyl aminopeptidase
VFNLIIKPEDGNFSYKPYSLALYYIIDGKNLEKDLANCVKKTGMNISVLQKKNFLSKDNNEIRGTNKDRQPDDVIISKVKIDEKFSPDYFRNHIAGLINNLQHEEISSLHIFIPDSEFFNNYFRDKKYFYRTFIEGIFLGNYSFNQYKSDHKKEKSLEIFIHGDKTKLIKSAINTSKVLMKGVFFTKDIQNEPAINLTPELLASRIKSSLSNPHIKVKIFDVKEIIKRRWGAYLL